MGGTVGVIAAAVKPASAIRTLTGMPLPEKMGTIIIIAVTLSMTSSQVLKISGITTVYLRSTRYTRAVNSFENMRVCSVI